MLQPARVFMGMLIPALPYNFLCGAPKAEEESAAKRSEGRAKRPRASESKRAWHPALNDTNACRAWVLGRHKLRW